MKVTEVSDWLNATFEIEAQTDVKELLPNDKNDPNYYPILVMILEDNDHQVVEDPFTDLVSHPTNDEIILRVIQQIHSLVLVNFVSSLLDKITDPAQKTDAINCLLAKSHKFPPYLVAEWKENLSSH